MIETRQLRTPFYLAHPLVQTAFASLKFRVSGKRLRQHSSPRLLTTKEGVRLLGSLAAQTGRRPLGLVILIHGWEGGIESTYMLRTGEFLFREGYDVFRLNLRDHGETHHLNEMPFNGTLIEETYDAVQQIAVDYGKAGPVFIMGFSLGGNFALRLALAHSTETHAGPRRSAGKKRGIANLSHVIAISPAVDPEAATRRIDADILLGRYFLKKWSESLLRKEALFPYLHDFPYVRTSRSVMELTGIGIPRFTPFAHVPDYFARYTLTGNAFERLTVPCTIYTAKDDPIIREEDFRRIHPAPLLRIILSDRGGHNGFLTGTRFDCAYFDLFREIADSKASPGPGKAKARTASRAG